MSYRTVKWMILIIPTVTIGLWEYVRHEFLLPYISMELGNVLAPVIVFLVTILFLTQLFRILERYRNELEQTKALQAVMEEREKIARELHDGIAQSLFLLNVQVDRIEQTHQVDEQLFQKLKQNVHQAHAYVRQAIANLREPAEQASVPWMQGIGSLIEEIKQESDLDIALDWRIPDQELSPKEKIELLAIMRESLMNVYKHAEARHVRIIGDSVPNGGWRCMIADDGKGLPESLDDQRPGHYGLRVMEDRARRMRWEFSVGRHGLETVVMIMKHGEERR